VLQLLSTSAAAAAVVCGGGAAAVCFALQLLEACVKNSVPFFFQQLIYSDLWQEVMRAGEPMRNVSAFFLGGGDLRCACGGGGRV
jgi:hypothetical protein